MSDYFTVYNRDPVVTKVHNFKKNGKFTITEKGRYGPKWFQRLAFKLVKSLGMVQNDKYHFIDEKITYKRIWSKDAEIEKRIFKACEPLFRNGHKSSDLILICSNDFFTELVGSRVGTVSFAYPVWIGGGDYPGSPPRFHDIQIVITDYLEGFIVIPKRHLLGAK